MGSLQNLFSQALASLEFGTVYLLGKIIGISVVVRYLRNPDPRISPYLLRSFGAKVGKKTTIKRSLYLDNVFEDKDSAGNFSHLSIGENCYIGDCVYFDLANEIVLGNHVVVSGKVSIVTHSDCNRSEYLARIYPRKSEPVVVGDGAWIGFSATILAGVKIGTQSVIAANTLVRGNTESQSLYAGIPARLLSSFEKEES